MPDNKINIPSINVIDPKKEIEVIKNEREIIKSNAQIQNGKLGMALESIKVLNKMLDVFKAREDYKTTAERWKGEVEKAKKAVDKAKIKFKITQKETDIKTDLEQSEKIINHFLRIADEIWDEIEKGGLSNEERKEKRKELMELGDLMAKLKK